MYIMRFWHYYIDLPTIIILTTYIIGIIVLCYVLIKREIKRRKTLNESYDLITKHFIEGTINYNRIELIYRRFVIPYYNIPLIIFLERYMLYIMRTQSSDFINSYGEQIENIIKEENTEKPFDGVEEHEKRLLILIEESAKRGETSSIPFNLSELARVIQAKEKSYRSTKILNTYSIPIAVLGIVLTILFGLKSPSMPVEDIEKIAIEIKELVNRDSINY